MRRSGFIFFCLIGLSACSRRDARLDLSQYVLIYPGAPVVELPGESKELSVIVRNVSEVKLTKLRLKVKSVACRARVEPPQIDWLIPAERKTFKVTLMREKEKPRQRFPLQLTLQAEGLPVAAGLDLLVDLGLPMDKGWVDVGQVTLVHQTQSHLYYYLLAGLPLLLLSGWLLWRWSHPKPRASKAD